MRTLPLLLLFVTATAARAEDVPIIVGMPDGAVSEYLETGIASVALHTEGELRAQLTLGLHFRQQLDGDALLVVSFDDATTPGKEPTVMKRWVSREEQRKQVIVMSEPFRDLRCHAYRARVLLFEKRDGKLHGLGAHVQLIQSTVDFSRMNSISDLSSAQCPVIGR